MVLTLYSRTVSPSENLPNDHCARIAHVPPSAV
jgi:hypothetical protein